MLLLVDNVSSYFNDLQVCLRKLDAEYEVKKFDQLNGHNVADYDGVILSGRTNSNKAINVSNLEIIKSSYNNDKPLLGICYGAEITALAFNGSLHRLPTRIMGEQEVHVKEATLLTDKKTLNVFESHGYSISRLPEQFVSIAESETCKYEIIAHSKRSLFGTQFHPEVSRDGIEILNNFTELLKS